ncbi:hypothetical protein K438DRAFT_2001886 [Mycena galopus ATCC 62051]|nr:hypothetical protein K438DRAFT_2001886 [Mycena galopus ATCC 62051]
MKDQSQENLRAQVLLSVAEETKTEQFDSAIPPAISRCTGQKRALLIGIKISAEGHPEATSAHDDGGHPRYHYTPSEITILINDGIEDNLQPTHDNILAAILELVKDVKEGDQVCFHCAYNLSPRFKNEEEDGLDECLIPLDCSTTFDAELHEMLVRSLPSGSQLVIVLDTCRPGSLFNLQHFRCNRVYLPWIFRGKRRKDDIWNAVVRRDARLLTTFKTYNEPTNPARASLIIRPSTSSTPPSRSLTGIRGLAPIPKPGSLARLRAGSKGPSARLRTLTLSMPSVVKSKGQDMDKDDWILPDEDEAHWMEKHYEVDMEEGIVKADVTCLRSSQKAWDSNGIGMTLSLVNILREDPHQSLQSVLLRISHTAYSVALMQSGRYFKAYKRHAEEQDTEDNMARFRNPELESSRPLDMNRPWVM